METLTDFLRRLAIFEHLSDEELAALAAICKQYDFQTGALVAYQRDTADALFIVRWGRLEAVAVDDAGVVIPPRRYYGPGDYFDDTWLLSPKIHPATIRALEAGRLIKIYGEDFISFLQAYPNAELDLSEAAWQEVDRSLAAPPTGTIARVQLLPGELVEYESRRTGLLLAWDLTLPLALLVGIPLVVGVLLRSLSGSFTVGVVVITLLSSLIPLAFAVLRYLNWANDHLIITNKHLMHTEFDLTTLQGKIIKIPLDRVQSVTVLRPNLLETILGVGSVRVTTGAQDVGLIFDKIRQPQEAEVALLRVRQQTSSLEAGRSREALRAALEDYYQIPGEVSETQDEPPADAGEGDAPASWWSGWLRRQPPPPDPVHTVTYGRHWVVLVRRTWWLALLVIGIFWGGSWLWQTFPGVRIPLFGASMIFLLVIFLGVFYYYYENWANDVFQITDYLVIDIDRGPFGFTESRKTAELINVQNVAAERPSIWATLFGYGRVVIDTAGASAEIVFQDVTRPNEIQAEIFRRRDLLRRQQQAQDAVKRREEMTLLLDVYQQVAEQGKIPRRTPPAHIRGDGEGA